MEKNEIIKKLSNLVFYGNLDEETESVLLSAIELIKEQNAKIEGLKAYNKNLLDANTALSNEFLDCRQNAYRKFAEKLKQHKRQMKGFDLNEEFWDYAVLVETIDSLLKEMIGEEYEIHS